MNFFLQENYVQFCTVLDQHGVAIVTDEQHEIASGIATKLGRVIAKLEGNEETTRFYFDTPITIQEADFIDDHGWDSDDVFYKE